MRFFNLIFLSIVYNIFSDLGNLRNLLLQMQCNNNNNWNPNFQQQWNNNWQLNWYNQIFPPPNWHY